MNTLFHVTKAPVGFDLLLGTNALGNLGFKLYDGPNNAMIDFETSDQEKKNHLTVIYKTILEPHSTKILELSGEKFIDGEEFVVSTTGKTDVRVEPSVVLSSGGKVFAPVTNWSSSPVILEHGSVVGNTECLHIMGETENFLDSSLIVKQTRIGFSGGIAENNSQSEVIGILKERIGSLSDAEEERLLDTVGEFGEIFALRDEDLTQTCLVEHEVDTGDAAPIRQKMRPVPYAYREKVAEMIQDYLGRGLVRPSQSPWASPMVIVPKRDGTLRFCVDFRGFNSVTRKDSFPLPNIDNTLLMLGARKFFTTLDFMSGYWQIRMADNSVEKTAFATEFGLHEFIVMPFGLSNAVATFQRFMSRLFEGLINDFVFVYIDDILIAS